MQATLEHRDTGRFAIDPFAGAPDAASRIAGLGDGAGPAEPGHVFRTLPIMAVPGPAAFEVAIDGLAGAGGTLHLELTVKGQGEAAPPVREKTLALPLAATARRGGQTLAFEAHPNMLYALAGYLHGGGDVRATGLRVELVTGELPAPASAEAVELPRLTSLDDPDFGDPVSQPVTLRQLRHPAFRRWQALLDSTGDRLCGEAFVLQALDRYGSLRPEARGLGIDAGAGVATVLGKLGCVTDRCPLDALPEDVAYDFAWSIDLADDAAALERRLWAGVDRVVPGGFSVQVFRFSPAGGGIGRTEVERLALNIISFGREIAQLKFRQTGAERGGVPFGLIVRREAAA